MKTTRSQASKRLFKKLSALRATLSNEERKILDELIVSEVAAHKLTSKSIGKAVSKSANKASEVAAHKLTSKSIGKAAGKSVNKASEVAAHKLTSKSIGKAAGKSANKASEVAAHKMTSKAASKAASKPTFRIAFDPNSEEYKIQA